MSVPTQRSPEAADSVPVTLARLEGKVDAALAQQGVTIAGHAADIADHETRLRAVEVKPTVSPRQLWTVIGSAVAVFATLSPLLERLYSIQP